MVYKDILLRGLIISSQLKVFHWQTKDNSQHQFFNILQQEFNKKNDQLLQTIMGNLGKKIGVGNGIIQLNNITNLNLEYYLQECAQFYQKVLYFLHNQRLHNESNIVQDIINLFRRGLYLIRQQSKIKSKNILKEMNKSNDQLLLDLLREYKQSIINQNLNETSIPSHPLRNPRSDSLDHPDYKFNDKIKVGKEYKALRNYRIFHKGDKIMVVSHKGNQYGIKINGKNDNITNSPFKVDEKYLMNAIGQDW